MARLDTHPAAAPGQPLPSPDVAGVELIVGARRVTPQAVRPVAGGIEVELRGPALLAVLDASFQGQDSIEVLGGRWHRHRAQVSAISMQGASSRVLLTCAERCQPLN